MSIFELKIGSNGVIGLGEQDFNSFTIYDINTETVKGKRIICPFWTDLITSGDDSYIYYQTYQRLVLNKTLRVRN